jgi:hypothetical protein
MRLMISGATTTVEDLARDPYCSPYLGTMVTPSTWNNVERMIATGLPYCLDNAAFNWKRFEPHTYLALLRRVANASAKPLFVTVPDQVGNHECTDYLFWAWQRAFIRADIRLPWAFVLQDGISSPDEIPWDFIDAIFIGGSDDFKDDLLVTLDLVPEAKRRGKHVHMGRVNGRARLRLAYEIGCDSVDGSSLSRFPRTWIPKFVADLRQFELNQAEQATAGMDLIWQLIS